MIEGPSECGRAETTISRLKMEFYHPLLDQMSNAEKALKKKKCLELNIVEIF